MKSCEGGTCPQLQDRTLVAEAKVVNVRESHAMVRKRRQLTITSKETSTAVETKVPSAVEVGPALRVKAAAHTQGSRSPDEPCEIRFDGVGLQTPRIEVEAIIETQRAAIAKRLAQPNRGCVAQTFVRYTLGQTEHGSPRTYAIPTDTHEAIRTRLISFESNALPLQLGQCRAREHLRKGGPPPELHDPAAEAWVPCASHRIGASETHQSQGCIALEEVSGQTHRGPQRTEVILERVPEPQAEGPEITHVADLSVRLEATLADGTGGSRDDVDRGARPRIHDLGGLDRDPLSHGGSGANLWGDDSGAVGIRPDIDGGRGQGGASRNPAGERPHDQRNQQRTHGSLSWLYMLILACLTACYPANPAIDFLDADALSLPTDLFVRDAGPGDVPTEPSACAFPKSDRTLAFTVRTVPLGGRFAPKNVGAVWIETSRGQFVRTLASWGKVRAKWLSAWLTASGGNEVDAITGATLTGHKVHEFVWGLRDVHGCEVAAGGYALRMELTDRNGAGATHTVSFDVGAEGFDLSPPDTVGFRDMRAILK